MKPVSLLLVLFFIMNGVVLAEENTNPAELILGLWKAEDKTIYNFTEDNILYVNDVKYAFYHFAANTLYLKYIVSGDDVAAGLEFTENKMILTEYKNKKNETTLILKQVPR